MSEYSLILPDDFEKYGWEIEKKGWFSEARLRVSTKEYRLIFYDPARLSQEIQSEHERSGVFFEPNLVIVETVTRAAMERAADALVTSGRVNFLTAEASQE